jgi:hypothetical protein
VQLGDGFQTTAEVAGGDVTCPDGTTVLGGGGSGDSGMDLVESAPTAGFEPHAWHVIARNPIASGSWSFTGYALCGWA